MKRKAAVVSVLLVVVLSLQVCQVDSWFGRRRRRRNPIPPPQNCQVSSWGSWSSCSSMCNTGTQSRSRSRTVQESWGGSCPYSLQETRSCGSYKNGCSGPGSQCNPSDGSCSCSVAGYSLNSGGKHCADINECSSNNNKGPCDHVCSNTAGSYTCSCNAGYSLSGKHACVAMDCNALTLWSCPSNSYQDQFSNVCKKVQSSCPSGTRYLQYCTLSCTSGYSLAKITSQPGKAFGEDYQSVDFSSVKSITTCALQQGGGVQWDLAQDLGSYYCRRDNDPPHIITLSGSTLQEHAASGTIIGSLSSSDYQHGQTFTYTVLSPSMLFTCQGQSLKSTWKDPDLHGSIPLVNGTINVTIRSTDNGLPPMWSKKTFSIKIQDVNDPPLNISLSNHEILENATVDSIIGVLSAVDGDEPPGTMPSSNFSWTLLDSSNGKFNLSGGNVVVAQKLNHEAEKIHQIKVRCTDRGSPPASSEKTFVISVLDLNEPVSLTLSSSSVPENSPNGTVVGILRAVDEDNDVVTFNISKSNADTLSKFTLSSTSHSKVGRSTTYQTEVKVKGDLDYERQNSYQFVVEASDRSGKVLREWTLSVINVNEKPDVNLTGSHVVNENSLAGTIVGDFVVTDPDNQNSVTQTHSCSLENSPSGDNSYFMVGSNTVLKVAGGANTINYESKRDLSITVRCTDSGHPTMSIIRNFNISVQDVNEPPTSLMLSNLTVPENSPLGTVVGTLSSDDPEKSYQSYTYSIVGPDGTPFILGGPSNTSVIVNGPLDYEKAHFLNLVVRVTDSGGLFREEAFRIQLLDMNDPPTDINLPGIGGQVLGIKENSGENVIISEITLVDQDKDTPRCTLVDDAGGRVAILAAKHLVAGPTKTDYESSADKQLQITLNCSDGHDAFVSKSFNIKILDVNEPITDIQVSNLTVPENQANAVVGIITVIDPDISQSHVCSVCDVIQGDSCVASEYFVVDAALELKTKKALNFEAKHIHDVVINCTDVVTDPQKPLSKKKAFSISVEDVNEQPSSLCPSPFHMSIDDSNGAVIALLNALDPDNEGSVSNKQSMLYSTNDNIISDAPFRLTDNRIFKYKEISEPQNYTIDIKVTDDGRIVSGFSSNGYIYSMEGSLSRVFTCDIIASKSHPSSLVSLNPNTVSVMATDGTVIGTLTSNLTESLTYTLLNADILPFAIEDNKLKIKQTMVHNFRDFGSKKDLFTYIEIKTVGQTSGTRRSGLYIHIINDAPQVPMCLVKSYISENTTIRSIVGQLLIEDSNPPKYPCSKTGCCSQVNNIPVNAFDYQCRVNNPDENAIIGGNVTSMFYIDERYLLRSKKIFNYQDHLASEGSIEVRISCHDLTRPLHIIGKNFTVKILDCSPDGECPTPPECGHCYNGGSCQDTEGSYTCLCQKGFTGSNCKTDIDYCEENPCKNGGTCQDIVTTFNCSCVTGYSGVLCDRNNDLCSSCSSDTLCATFTEAAIRCLSEDYQAPVLVGESNLTEARLWEIENEIANLADENKEKLSSNTIESRRKRRSASTFYVETLQSEAVADKTLLRLAIMDSRNDYKPLLAKDACTLLAGTNRHCVDENDCTIINRVGKACPEIGGSSLGQSGNKGTGDSGLSAGGSTGIALCVLFVILAVLIGAIYYYRRKYQKAKQDQQPVVNYNQGETNIEFSNPSYVNDVTADQETLEEMARDRMAKENLVGINLDPTSVKKRNDIKVTENVLYRAPDGDRPPPILSTQNPLYVSGAEARGPKRANVDEEKPKNNNTAGKWDLKHGKEPVYEDLDTIKSNAKKMAEDFDPEKEKMKVRMNSACGTDVSYEDWDPEVQGKAKQTEEKPNNSRLSEDNRPRYEDSPISFKHKPRKNQYENVGSLVHANPVYENTPVQHGRGAEKHVYDNLKQNDGVITGTSIINPVYEQAAELTDGIGDCASGLEDPLYERILPEKGKPPVEEKSKRRSFLRSVSSEKAAGYEELEKNNEDGDEDEDDDAVDISQA